ncbi:hypothetical protein OHB49_29025 [Streptomyces sp. NBC_01717]|uniref:hypothetical protein n=1 Tax=Streptomyces sp. NBC_01717 TaxID=2975918 RepID=UPI002E2FD0D7|nr:hypothetical protein [Streptomyces sp. NBC_01717]
MKTRDTARAFLLAATGEARPEWRTAFTTDGTAEPTGIAPVCPDEDHDPDDGSVYPCCPNPAIECLSPEIAAHLAELLNADRGAK